MKTFTVKANVVRAAQIFQAQNDVRYYLNGVFVGQDGMIAGTNGHAAFVSSHDADIDQDYIIQIAGVIPKTAKEIELTIIDGKVIVDCKDRHDKTVKLLAGRILDGKYPDVKKVIPDYSDEAMKELIGRNEISVQAQYMANVSKVFSSSGDFDGVNIKFKDSSSVMLITSTVGRLYPENTFVLIMPVRT